MATVECGVTEVQYSPIANGRMRVSAVALKTVRTIA